MDGRATIKGCYNSLIYFQFNFLAFMNSKGTAGKGLGFFVPPRLPRPFAPSA